jgi:hypothetical protein
MHFTSPEMDKAGKYKNLFDCFQKVAKAEGMGALYRGLPAVSMILVASSC